MKIAVQMYSARNYVREHGYGAALRELARIGFTSVEHACGFGEFDGKPKELKKMLDDLGMTLCGTHVGAEAFSDPGQRGKTVDLYAELGARYLICPGDGRFYDADAQAQYIDLMNEAAAFLQPYGMFCGHHNHMNEFLIHPKTGKSYWETFAEATCPDVVLEQDCGWSTMASRDAAALIRQYPGRSRALHFKPAVRASQPEKLSIIGSDSVPWKAVIDAAREVGGTDVAVVEQEWYLPGKTDMESIEASFRGLAGLL